MNFGKFCSGVALTIVGTVMLLKNVTIGGVSFYSFHGMDTGAIVVICMIASFVWLVANVSVASTVALGISSLLFILSLILGTRIYINKMDMLGFIIICALMFGGIGLIINSFKAKHK